MKYGEARVKLVEGWGTRFGFSGGAMGVRKIDRLLKPQSAEGGRVAGS